MTKQGMAEQDEGVASLHAKTNSDQSHFPLGPNQAFLSTIPAGHAVGDDDPSRQYEPATKQWTTQQNNGQQNNEHTRFVFTSGTFAKARISYDRCIRKKKKLRDRDDDRWGAREEKVPVGQAEHDVAPVALEYDPAKGSDEE